MPDAQSRTVRVLLTALVAFGPMSTDLYLPSLPTLMRVFDTDIPTLQLTLSVYMLGFAVAQLVHGPLADRFGRRPALTGAVALYVVASGLCATARSVEALIAARFLQSLGACGAPVIARAVVRDVFGRERSASMFAAMGTAMALAPAVAPIIGGALTEALGWRSSFLFLVLFGSASLIAVRCLLAETAPPGEAAALHPITLGRAYARLFVDRRFLGPTLVASFAFCGIFAFISGSSHILIGTLGLSPVAFGLSFAIVAAGLMGGSLLAGRLSARLGGDRVMRVGTLVSIVGGGVGALLAVALPPNPWATVVPMGVYVCGSAMTAPHAMAGAIGPFPRAAGLASALLGFAQMTAAAAVGMVVAALSDGTARGMFGVVAVVAILAYLARSVASGDRGEKIGPS